MTAMNTWLRGLHQQITQLQSVPPCECAAALRAGALQSAFEGAPCAVPGVAERAPPLPASGAGPCLESTLQAWCRPTDGTRASGAADAVDADSPTAHVRPAPGTHHSQADESCSASLLTPRPLVSGRAQAAALASNSTAARSPSANVQGGVGPVERLALSSALESALLGAARQKAAAAAVLTSPASQRSGMPAWAAELDENSNPNSPLRARTNDAACWPQERTAPAAASDAGDSDAQLLSLQHSLATAASEQQGLVEAVQLQFARTQERVVAAALELDALQAELEAVREQVRVPLALSTHHRCACCFA